MAELEGRADQVEKDISGLRESHDELKKAVSDHRMDVVREISDLKVFIAGEVGKLQGRAEVSKDSKQDGKWAISLVVSAAFSVASLVLAALAFLLRR